MREKSRKNLQDRIKELTVRSCNLDATVISKLNQIIRGSAGYFVTPWFTGRHVLKDMDAFIRRRLRCMRYKRFRLHDNRRMRLKQFQRLGLLSLESFCSPRGRPSGRAMSKNA